MISWLKKFREWRDDQIFRQSSIRPEDWREAIQQLPLLHRLNTVETDQLIRLATVFLSRKTFSGAHDLLLTDAMQRLIALQACLPILNLGLDWYRGWRSIIVYPAGFFAEQSFTDESGVTHRQKRALSGEAWGSGPVILSWEAVAESGVVDGDNLVIHEFAHKLDMRNGVANGFPPLHRDMDTSQWSHVFAEAFAHFRRQLDLSRATTIDSYAGYSPAEFFSVLSELFFERPDIIIEAYPEVYQLLTQFYRQDTLSSIR